MARHRYQVGHVFKRGKRRKVWVGRWREDVVENGEVRRVHRSEVLGLASDLTKTEARTKLSRILGETNQHQPRQIVTFREFALKWESTVLPSYKFSTRRSYKHYLHKHLLTRFGDLQLSTIQVSDVQQFITEKARTYSGKTVRHLRNLLSSLFSRTAKICGYTTSS